MPELPEVETSLRGVEPYLQGQTIKQIIARTPKLRWRFLQRFLKCKERKFSHFLVVPNI